ncbi:hypothetical protein K490DRAFT_66906 [Saccharata proteae CBS 121410]|uniref:Uncharacterized protein n=1 Tax=Saccharata proteae CBS 121410 TaxID=1314787 RepID=A0A9P4LYV6_9PEZI|nr:hypothetical protein K490DRAFT_66906 [Saccharata proteae CBS 121410]
MLSRAQTDAGTRLRRAKSSVSVHSQPRSSPRAEPIDPVVAREHATAAALSAFERAYAVDRANAAADRRYGPSRQKSSASRTSQGSHFPSRETSFRSGRDAAAAQRGRVSPKPRRPSHERKHARAFANVNTPHAAMRNEVNRPPKESFTSLPPPLPLPAHVSPQVPSASTAPVTPIRQNVRKSRSMYNSLGLGRNTSKARETASLDAHRYMSQAFDDKDLTMTTDYTTASSFTSPAADAKDAIKLAEIAAARDKYLQDFQQTKLRSRPSFMTPFRKYSGKHGPKSNVTYDDPLPESSEPMMDMSRLPIVKNEDKGRSISNSLKSKIKRVFRKTSNTSVGLPVQQVTASSMHFGDSVLPSPRPPSGVPFTGYGEFSKLPSVLPDTSPDPQSQSRVSSGGQARSDGEVSNTKSRVTSWTNSSAGNSISTRDSKRLSIIPENGVGMLRRQASSLLRRAPFKKPLHSQSIADDLDSSVDTQGVYTALKMRLQKAGLEGDPSAEALDEGLADLGRTIHDTLPSQAPRVTSNPSKLHRVAKTTIRAVTPEDATSSHGLSNITSNPPPTYSLPVESHFGPTSSRVRGDGSRDSPDDDESDLAVPRIRLQRASKIVQPTEEQLAIRKNRADKRWQAPLEERGPVFPKDTQRALSGADRPQKTFLSRLKTGAGNPETPERPFGQFESRSKDALAHPPGLPQLDTPLSPSVYSRDSDGESPVIPNRAISGSTVDDGLRGTAVIMSSPPVVSYPVGSSPPKKPSHSARSSRDWRAWLSREVAELETENDPNITISEDFIVGHRREHAEIESDDTAAATHAPNPVPAKSASNSQPQPVRPGLIERSSSRMNERFPMIETGRKRSDKSITTLSERKKSKTPSPQNHPSSSTKSSTTKSSTASESVRAKDPCSTKFLQPTIRASSKQSQGPHQTGDPIPGRSNSSLAHYTTTAEEGSGAAKDNHGATKTKGLLNSSLFRCRTETQASSTHAKSAFDLRGQYKFREYTSPNLRRKPYPGPAMEGETLQMILQGPYTPLKMTSGEKENLKGARTANTAENESPTRSAGTTPTGGQKLAERWLSERQQGMKGRLRSASPAFL